MSYSFNDAGTTRLAGTMTSSYGDPLTMACFIKISAHPSATDHILAFGNALSANDSYVLHTTATANQWRFTATDSVGSTAPATVSSVDIGTGWTGIVGRVDATDTSRNLVVGDIANISTNNTDTIVADTMTIVRVGRSLVAGNYFTGLIAEVAIWNTALSDSQVTSYLSRISATTIAPANLIGYWSLAASANPQTNEGTDAGGDLTVTNATFDSDHPVITTGVVPVLLSQYRSRRGS